MGARIQLAYPNTGYINVVEGTNVPVNLAISDIKDLSKRTGGFTKTVTAIGDKETNITLGHLFDINIQTGKFDRNKKAPVILLDDDLPMLAGDMRLMSVKKMGNSNNTWDQDVMYELIIKDNTSTFYLDLGDKELTDLDFSDMDHLYNTSTVLGSISNDVNDGWKYTWSMSAGGPNDSEYNLNEFQPSIYLKQYFDRIFATAGKTYTWASQDDESIQFSKILLAYGGGTPALTPTDIDAISVRAMDTNREFTTPGTAGTQTGFSKVLNLTKITDPDVVYNEITGQYYNKYYLSASGNRTTISVTATYKLVLRNQSGATAYLRKNLEGSGTAAAGFKYTPSIYIKRNNVIQAIGNFGPTQTVATAQGAATPYALPVGDTVIHTYTNQLYEQSIPPGPNDFFPGDMVTEFINLAAGQSNPWNDAIWATTSTGAKTPALVDVVLVMDTVEINIRPNMTGLGFNSKIKMNNYVMKKVKQRDLIKSIFTKFNLYCDLDENDSNNLIIQRRDDYYDSGVSKDWTKKLNLDLESNIEFAPDLVAKRMVLTDLLAKDDLSQNYFTQTGEVYGQIDYTFDDENIVGETKIETQFEPMPMLKTGYGAYVNAIYGNKPETGLRLIYDGGQKTAANNYKIYEYGNTIGYNGPIYGYTGHLDDPINPTFDLCFGINDFYYYTDYQNFTNNNQFNLHWRRTFGQINNGKVLTAYFNLNPRDINQLKLNDKIFIKDAYWNIQEVIDYNANSRQPTKVKLITIDNDLLFAKFKTKKPIKPGVGSPVIANPVRGVVGAIKDGVNVFDSSGVNIVSGVRNIFAQDSKFNLVVGSGNYIEGEKNTVMGDNLKVVANGAVVQFTQNNISAGTDEILNPFNVTGNVNIIHGSFDAIRIPGGNSTVSQINGRTDAV